MKTLVHIQQYHDVLTITANLASKLQNPTITIIDVRNALQSALAELQQMVDISDSDTSGSSSSDSEDDDHPPSEHSRPTGDQQLEQQSVGDQHPPTDGEEDPRPTGDQQLEQQSVGDQHPPTDGEEHPRPTGDQHPPGGDENQQYPLDDEEPAEGAENHDATGEASEEEDGDDGDADDEGEEINVDLEKRKMHKRLQKLMPFQVKVGDNDEISVR
jgi:hypothetical protein